MGTKFSGKHGVELNKDHFQEREKLVTYIRLFLYKFIDKYNEETYNKVYNEAIEIVNSLSSDFPFDYITKEYFDFISERYYDNPKAGLEFFKKVYSSRNPLELARTFNWYFFTHIVSHRKEYMKYDMTLLDYGFCWIENREKFNISECSDYFYEIVTYFISRLIASQWIDQYTHTAFVDTEYIDNVIDKLITMDLDEILCIHCIRTSGRVNHLNDDELEYIYKLLMANYFNKEIVIK